MEIRFATVHDRAALCDIWLSAFPADTKADCMAFLDLVDLPTECMVACKNATPVSMVFLLPATMVVDHKEYSLCYIYAAATHADHRGNGTFSVLLNEALRLQKEKGIAASFLSPQEPSLVRFYQRFGYVPISYRHTLKGAATSNCAEIKKVTHDVYKTVRQPLLPPVHICWDDRFLKAEISAFEAVRVQGNGYALCRKNGSDLYIAERLGTALSHETCGQLAAYFECSTYTASAEGQMGDCFGMILPLTDNVPIDRTVYMGFSFG